MSMKADHRFILTYGQITKSYKFHDSWQSDHTHAYSEYQYKVDNMRRKVTLNLSWTFLVFSIYVILDIIYELVGYITHIPLHTHQLNYIKSQTCSMVCMAPACALVALSTVTPEDIFCATRI
jgi:hypothetical protein